MVTLVQAPQNCQQSIESNRGILVALAKLESIECLKADEQAPESATSLVGDMRLLIPLANDNHTESQFYIADAQSALESLQVQAVRISAI